MSIKKKLLTAAIAMSLATSTLAISAQAATTGQGTVVSDSAKTGSAKTASKAKVKSQYGLYSVSKLSWKALKPDDLGIYEDAWKACSKTPIQYAYKKDLGMFIFKNTSKYNVMLDVGGSWVDINSYDSATCKAPKDSKIKLSYFSARDVSAKAAFTADDIIIDSVKAVKSGTKITWHYNIPKGKYLAVNPFFNIYGKTNKGVVADNGYYRKGVAGYRVVKSSKTKFSMTFPVKYDKAMVVHAMAVAGCDYISKDDYAAAIKVNASDYFDVEARNGGNQSFELKVKTVEPLNQEFVLEGFEAYAVSATTGKTVKGSVDLYEYTHCLSANPAADSIYVEFDTPVDISTIKLRVFGRIGYSESLIKLEQVDYKVDGSNYTITFENTGDVPVFCSALYPCDDSNFPDLANPNGEVVFSDGTVVKSDRTPELNLFLDCGESAEFRFKDVGFENVTNYNWAFLDVITMENPLEWHGLLEDIGDSTAVSASALEFYLNNKL